MKKTLSMAALALLVGCGAPRLEAPDCSGGVVPANLYGVAPVVWDDRTDTWLRFPGQQRRPSISVMREDGTEAAVNTSPAPNTDTIRVHGIHPKIVLRDGERVACIVNQAYDRVGVRTGATP